MTADWLTDLDATTVSWTNTHAVMGALKDLVCNAGGIELAESLEDCTKFYDLVSELFVTAAVHLREDVDVPSFPCFASFPQSQSGDPCQSYANLVKFMKLFVFTPLILET